MGIKVSEITIALLLTKTINWGAITWSQYIKEGKN